MFSLVVNIKSPGVLTISMEKSFAFKIVRMVAVV